jgi:subtilase family serine protease
VGAIGDPYSGPSLDSARLVLEEGSDVFTWTSASSGRPRVPVVLATVAVVAAALLLAARPAHAESTVRYPSSVPAWASVRNDAGPAPATETVTGEIWLSLRNRPAAVQLAAAVSTPGALLYRHWMSPRQWIDAFAPSAADYDTLLAFLRGSGMTITGTPASRLFVVFRGTAAQMAAAFGTPLHVYTVAGRRLVAPAGAPALPSALGGVVSGIELDQGRGLAHPGRSGPGAVPGHDALPAAPPPACSSYYGEHRRTMPPAYGRVSFETPLCGYVPAQLRSAYGVPDASTGVLAASGRPAGAAAGGAGQTVAIIDVYASPTIVQDADTYAAAHGEPPLTTYSQILPPAFYDDQRCGGPALWQVEQTLDVEAVHGIAPAASILYVAASSCFGGWDLALSTVLDRRLATIVSNSYSWGPESITPADVLRSGESQQLQAAAEGIGLYYASGDHGDRAAIVGSPVPEYPGSTPWVTAVGGTSTGIARDGSVALETGWGSSVDPVVTDPVSGAAKYALSLPGQFLEGAGGGISAVFPQPDYQAGVVPGALAQGRRASPDIAADADSFTGMLIGVRPLVDASTGATGSYLEGPVGGTSLATPVIAGQVAVAQQLTGKTLGFANPTLYNLYQQAPTGFRDVLPPTTPFALADTDPITGSADLVTGDTDTSLTVTKGYDDVTGLGVATFGTLRRAAAG